MEKKYLSQSQSQIKNSQYLLELFKQCPIPDEDLLNNIELFIGRIKLQNILFIYEIYQQILNTHGIIIEFGTRYGHNLALFAALRGIYEPYVRSRKIVGFDTFEGLKSVSDKDGKKAQEGDMAVVKGYENFLEKILECHEQQSPISHIRKFELVKGNAPVELKRYLEQHPETIIALIYFDLDLYQPTKECLEILRSHITKGTIIGFDELCYEDHPGETVALKEVFGLDKYKIKRTPYSSSSAYIIL